jgi:hypothetical protein
MRPWSNSPALRRPRESGLDHPQKDNPMKTLEAAALAAGILVAMPAFAQKAPETKGVVSSSPGRVEAATATVVKGRIESIDAAKRTIVVKGPGGNSGEVAVGPEVKNFAQMKVGDEVALRYVEALALQLKKGGGGVRERTETKGAASAAPGARPAAVAGREVTVVADVVAVDPKTQTVTLRGPQRTVDLKVRDPSSTSSSRSATRSRPRTRKPSRSRSSPQPPRRRNSASDGDRAARPRRRAGRGGRRLRAGARQPRVPRSASSSRAAARAAPRTSA